MNEKNTEKERNKHHIFRICRRERQLCVMVSYIDEMLLKKKFEIFKILKKSTKKDLAKLRKKKTKKNSFEFLCLLLKNIFKDRREKNGVEFLKNVKKKFKEKILVEKKIEDFKKGCERSRKSRIFFEIFNFSQLEKLKKEQILLGLDMLRVTFRDKKNDFYSFFFKIIFLRKVENFTEIEKKENQDEKEDQENNFLQSNLIKNNVNPIKK